MISVINTNGLHRWWLLRRLDLAALGVIVIFFLLHFGWAVFGGKFLIGGDVFFYTFPMRTVFWEMVRQGVPPVWTPLVLGGFPILAMATLGPAYPLTWGHLFLPGHWAEQLYVLAPFLLAPAFIYAYAREINRGRVASLLAALSFAYGGMTTNTLGMNALPTNAVMWLPLVLVALERARGRRFIPCLVGASVAYAMSVLTGHGQSFLLVGLLALGYALFLSLAAGRLPAEGAGGKRPACAMAKGERWRPLWVALCALAFGAGVAAFQILETLRAVRRSLRRSISYDFFVQGSFTPGELWRSWLAPLYHYIDVTAYVAPLVCGLALYGVIVALRQRRSADPRVWFWLAAALVACVLMLGGNTPVYRWLYQVPVFNFFRVPSRHAFEWTLALGLLAAYGWDALRAREGEGQRATDERQKVRLRQWAVAATALLLTVLCAGLGWQWLEATRQLAGVSAGGGADDNPELVYVLWKAGFTLCVLVTLVLLWRLDVSRWRSALLAGVALLACFVEPFILVSHWWPGTAKPASRFSTPSLTTQFLQQFPPQENRVYVRANATGEEASPRPRLDALDLTALYGLHNTGGYESLPSVRYSRALGDVEFDSVNPLPGFPTNEAVFATPSHVLDILNTTHVVTFPHLGTTPAQTVEKDRVQFATPDLAFDVGPGASLDLDGAGAEGDTLWLVTTLAHATDVPQWTTVARLRVHTTDGRIVEHELRAGVDTAEWAHERADVRRQVRHALAPVFDSVFVRDERHGEFPRQRFWARLPLGERLRLDKIEIVNATERASLDVAKATVYDSATNQSAPLATEQPLTALDAERWQIVYRVGEVIVLRNRRALPRAWLAPEAAAVDGEEALRRIRGKSSVSFDPRRTALLEVPVNQLPVLPGGNLAPNSAARIVDYRPHRLTIETRSDKPAVLVVSEVNYPGWAAVVDGAPTTIHQTDYLLRGVVVPAGEHRVEMLYTAPAARNGAIISALTLLLLCSLFVYDRWFRGEASETSRSARP